MRTLIKVFSATGHTPISHRGGDFSDQLVDTVIDCRTPADAKSALLRYLNETPHAAAGSYYMPDYPDKRAGRQFIDRSPSPMPSYAGVSRLTGLAL